MVLVSAVLSAVGAALWTLAVPRRPGLHIASVVTVPDNVVPVSAVLSPSWHCSLDARCPSLCWSSRRKCCESIRRRGLRVCRPVPCWCCSLDVCYPSTSSAVVFASAVCAQGRALWCFKSGDRFGQRRCAKNLSNELLKKVPSTEEAGKSSSSRIDVILAWLSSFISLFLFFFLFLFCFLFCFLL